MPDTPEALELADRINQHNKEVAAGLIPEDSPPTFIRADWKPNENGLPGWFPPDFKAGQVFINGVPQEMPDQADGGGRRTPEGVQVSLAWDYFEDDESPVVSRKSLNDPAEGRRDDSTYLTAKPIIRPMPIPPPERIWTKNQKARLDRGYMSKGTGDPWVAFMEDDRIFLHRAATGLGYFEAQFTLEPDGWRITEAVVESDPASGYLRQCDALETTRLEDALFGAILWKFDADLEQRLVKEQARAESGPRFVITKAKGPDVPITRPGQSVKHGKLADQHPLQRDAYDRAYSKGFNAALVALEKGKTAQDVFHTANRHEKLAKGAVGIVSSQHAGLAKGAKMAAYEFSRGKISAIPKPPKA